MTAPTINGTRYPQPVDELLPKARELAAELGTMPSRNRLMREFRIGAPKADDLRARLTKDAEEKAREAGTDPAEMLRAAAALADQLGFVPATSVLADVFGIEEQRADALGGLVRMVRTRTGAPVDPVEDEPATDPWEHAEPIGPDPAAAICVGSTNGCAHCQTTELIGPGPGPSEPAPADPGTDSLDIALDETPEPPAEPSRAEAMRAAMIARGALLPPAGTSWTDPGTPGFAPDPEPAPDPPAAEPDEQVTTVGHPGTPTPAKPARRAVAWPIVLLALPAFVAIWGGWVGLGGLTGFGKVNLLPGIVEAGSWATIDSAITLPIGVETYGAYALYIWLSGRVPPRARAFAKWSAIASLVVGALGQVAYHLLVAAGVTSAPWQITALVACLPVAVLGMGAALAHLVREEH